MIRTMFACPQTGEPLATRMTAGGWPARHEGSVSMHCPRCGSLHRFERSQAILVLDSAQRVAADPS